MSALPRLWVGAQHRCEQLDAYARDGSCTGRTNSAFLWSSTMIQIMTRLSTREYSAGRVDSSTRYWKD
jgi:hypothetical protein